MAGRDQVAFVLSATKLASGNMQLIFFSTLDGANSNGQVKAQFVISAAQVAAIAALTSGQNSTVAYAENANSGDYASQAQSTAV